MGCAISCVYFERISTFLEWVINRESQVPSVLHCLDVFLFLGPGGSQVCFVLLCTMERFSESFGVPLAPKKTEGPMTMITFLGVTIDSDRM